MCYYFDDVITVRDIYFSDILLDQISYKEIRKYFNLWHFIQKFNGCKTITY